MNLKTVAGAGSLMAAMLVWPGTSQAARAGTCEAGEPTAASYTWNFPAEASGLLTSLEAGARQVADHADQLASMAKNQNLTWESHASQLTQIKEEVNEMGAKLCRLETIRRVVPRWQRTAIDRAAVTLAEMANNTTQAINYLDANREHLWNPAYEQYAANLFQEGQRLSQTVRNFEELAKVRQEQRSLEKALHVRAGA